MTNYHTTPGKYYPAQYIGESEKDGYQKGEVYHIAIVEGTFYPYCVMSQEFPDQVVEFPEPQGIREIWKSAKRKQEVQDENN